MSNNLEMFSRMCALVGSSATHDQVERLADFVRDHIGPAYYGAAEQIALESDIPHLFTELSMLRGENGY